MYDPAPIPVALPERRPVLPIDRLGAVLEIALCSGFPSQILLIMILQGFGMRVYTAESRLSPPFVFTLALLDAAVVVSLVIFILRAHRESIRDVLFAHRSTIREGLIGLVILPVILIVAAVVLALILTFAPQLHNVPRNPLEDMLNTRSDALIFTAVVMIAGGVREEIQRGFILHRFGQYLGGAGWGVVCWSALFGLGHATQGIDVMIATAVLGAIWGVLYLRRRSVVAPMVSHATFNLAQLAKSLVLAR